MSASSSIADYALNRHGDDESIADKWWRAERAYMLTLSIALLVRRRFDRVRVSDVTLIR